MIVYSSHRHRPWRPFNPPVHWTIQASDGWRLPPSGVDFQGPDIPIAGHMSGRHSRLPLFLVLGVLADLGFGPLACTGPGYWGGPTYSPAAAGVAIGDLNGGGKPDPASADGDIVVRSQVAGQPGVFETPVHYPK